MGICERATKAVSSLDSQFQEDCAKAARINRKHPDSWDMKIKTDSYLFFKCTADFPKVYEVINGQIETDCSYSWAILQYITRILKLA